MSLGTQGYSGWDGNLLEFASLTLTCQVELVPWSFVGHCRCKKKTKKTANGVEYNYPMSVIKC